MNPNCSPETPISSLYTNVTGLTCLTVFSPDVDVAISCLNLADDTVQVAPAE